MQGCHVPQSAPVTERGREGSCAGLLVDLLGDGRMTPIGRRDAYSEWHPLLYGDSRLTIGDVRETSTPSHFLYWYDLNSRVWHWLEASV